MSRQVSKGTLSAWLRDIPLTSDEIEAKVEAGDYGRSIARRNAAPVPGVPLPFSRPVTDESLRRASIGVAIAWFAARSYDVSVPVEQCPYDLVVESDTGLKKIQVKSTTRRAENGRWLVNIFRNGYSSSAAANASGRRNRRAYSASEIDFFFILTADQDVYIIPLAVTGGATTLSLDSKYSAFKQLRSVA